MASCSSLDNTDNKHCLQLSWCYLIHQTDVEKNRILGRSVNSWPVVLESQGSEDRSALPGSSFCSSQLEKGYKSLSLIKFLAGCLINYTLLKL